MKSLDVEGLAAWMTSGSDGVETSGAMQRIQWVWPTGVQRVCCGCHTTPSRCCCGPRPPAPARWRTRGCCCCCCWPATPLLPGSCRPMRSGLRCNPCRCPPPRTPLPTVRLHCRRCPAWSRMHACSAAALCLASARLGAVVVAAALFSGGAGSLGGRWADTGAAQDADELGDAEAGAGGAGAEAGGRGRGMLSFSALYNTLARRLDSERSVLLLYLLLHGCRPFQVRPAESFPTAAPSLPTNGPGRGSSLVRSLAFRLAACSGLQWPARAAGRGEGRGVAG